MEVDSASTAATTCYHGKMIFFCAEGCKNAFETDPKAYTIAKRKGFWRRYFERQEKNHGWQVDVMPLRD